MAEIKLDDINVFARLKSGREVMFKLSEKQKEYILKHLDEINFEHRTIRLNELAGGKK